MQKQQLEDLIDSYEEKPKSKFSWLFELFTASQSNEALKLLRETLDKINNDQPNGGGEMNINKYYRPFSEKLGERRIVPELRISLFIIQWEKDAGLGHQPAKATAHKAKL